MYWTSCFRDARERKPPMAYKDTEVPISRSQEQIQKILKKHGAKRFAFGQDLEDDTTYALVRFEHEGLGIRMRVPLKEPTLQRIRNRAAQKRKGEERAYDDLMDAEAQRIWRVIHYNLKARMEAVEEGVEAFAEAFMAHVILDNGRTIYESLVETGRVELPEPLSDTKAIAAAEIIE